MTTTPIFDALYREHRNAGMAYPGAPDVPSDEQRTRTAAPQRARARRSATVGEDQGSSPDGEPDGPPAGRLLSSLDGRGAVETRTPGYPVSEREFVADLPRRARFVAGAQSPSPS
ncbi:MAG: hypothetical protein ABR608_07390 [Pseudonocardiaceae bacterium]